MFAFQHQICCTCSTSGNTCAGLFHTFLSSLDLCFNGQGSAQMWFSPSFLANCYQLLLKKPRVQSLNPSVSPGPACHSQSTAPPVAAPQPLPYAAYHIRLGSITTHYPRPGLVQLRKPALCPLQADVVLERAARLSKRNLFYKLCDGVKVA